MRSLILSSILGFLLTLTSFAQDFDATIAALDPDEAGVTAEDIDVFASIMHSVPDRARAETMAQFSALEPLVQSLVLRTFARFRGEDERGNIRLAFTTTNLFTQISARIHIP